MAEPVVVFMAELHDVADFARGVRGGVLSDAHYDPAAQLLTATDGCLLVRVPVQTRDAEDLPVTRRPLTPPTKPVLIPARLIRDALACAATESATAGASGYVMLSIDEASGEGPACVRLVSATGPVHVTHTAAAGSGEYPDAAEVWPTTEPVARVRLMPRLIARLAAYAARVGAECDETPIDMEFRADHCTPIVFRFRARDAGGETVEGLLMPMEPDD